jgi:hypothetical protein
MCNTVYDGLKDGLTLEEFWNILLQKVKKDMLLAGSQLLAHMVNLYLIHCFLNLIDLQRQLKLTDYLKMLFP